MADVFRRRAILFRSIRPRCGKPSNRSREALDGRFVSICDGGYMKLRAKEFRVKEGEKVKLAKWPTEISPFYKSKEDYEKCLRQHVEDLASLQNLLYAH